jgi:Spy/CpxP family protein refolding chaperone
MSKKDCETKYKEVTMSRSRLMIATVLIGVLAIGLANVATAAKKPKGSELFKEFCKPCHEAGSANGEYTPMTLIQDQWERFFDDKYEGSHSAVLDPAHDNKPVTEVISKDDLKEIKSFAIDHAADSEHPMTCG